MSEFSNRLLAWFDAHGRKDLPWQKNASPYRVWVSEIMLQQTQVRTVIPYFDRFMQRFPNLPALADAARDEVLSYWSGLGYYARARNLHKAAQRVRDEHGGEFPGEFDDVLALPGIGRSTAGAILALAHGQRHSILDGNVKRVLARHGAIAGWPGETGVQNNLWKSADEKTPRSRVAEYTQAIMDLGATLCTRSRPSCEQCPLAEDCSAYRSDTVAEYPGRKAKPARPLRATTMMIASADNAVYLERRPEAGIWGGLWSFPELGERSVADWCGDVLGPVATEIQSWDVVRHSFSHFDLDIQPIVVRTKRNASRVCDVDGQTWYKLAGTPPGGIAAPVRKIIDQLKKSENVTHC